MSPTITWIKCEWKNCTNLIEIRKDRNADLIICDQHEIIELPVAQIAKGGNSRQSPLEEIEFDPERR